MLYDILINICNVIFNLAYRIKVTGLENVPMDGKLVVSSNHTNNLDPVIISMYLPRKIAWMGKRELFKNKIVAFIVRKVDVFPVNRDEVDIGAIKQALKILKEDRVLGIFPEGTRVKKMDLNNAKSGASLLAIRSKAPVLPIYIDGNYKIFSKINITIGKPMYLHENIIGKPTPEQYSEFSKEILSKIYSLKNQEVK
nr:lysophospholipid acyltransferase family protein [Tissierella sp.]